MGRVITVEALTPAAMDLSARSKAVEQRIEQVITKLKEDSNG